MARVCGFQDDRLFLKKKKGEILIIFGPGVVVRMMNGSVSGMLE